MFTGIITHIGEVKKINFSNKKDCELEIFVQQKITRKLDIGCSIACNGICLTLVKKLRNSLFFQASKETCDKTTLASWVIGQKINLEFSLQYGDEMGGHFVSGHVDGCAILVARKPVKGSVEMIFSFGKKSEFFKMILKKGSICINGVSLTVNNTYYKLVIVSKMYYNLISLNIIPHTIENTSLKALKINDEVNFEIDIITKQIAKILENEK